jgi:hypothetical protein
MTPLLKLKISSHLRIERLRSTLPKHPEFAVSGCIYYGYKTPEPHLYLAFPLQIQKYGSNHRIEPYRLYRTDAERQIWLDENPSGPTRLKPVRLYSAGLVSNESGRDMPKFRAHVNPLSISDASKCGLILPEQSSG